MCLVESLNALCESPLDICICFPFHLKILLHVVCSQIFSQGLTPSQDLAQSHFRAWLFFEVSHLILRKSKLK